MVEHVPTPEIEQELLKALYKDAIDFAVKYGVSPAEAMGMPSDGKVFKEDIDRETQDHTHSDLLSGRYYGPNTGQIALTFRHFDRQFRFELSKQVDDTGKERIVVDNPNVYQVEGLDDPRRPRESLMAPSKEVTIDDLNILVSFLKKARVKKEQPKDSKSLPKKRALANDDLIKAKGRDLVVDILLPRVSANRRKKSDESTS
jgi:hypothetical protein